MAKSVTLIEGDGIGPEVVQATRRVVDASGIDIKWELCEAGAQIFKKGIATGVPQETIDSILKNKVALKGPLETPVGYGEKSANVTLRALFSTFANTRPVHQIPGVNSPFSDKPIDFVVVRENVEDLYAGIEYLETPSAAVGLKLITRKGSEKIIRFAFELARSQGRKKVHCATKANILKLTEGMFKRTFEEVAPDYPDIEPVHIIIDNCAHQMVRHPENFDVIVTTNLHGDIISDLGSGLVGGLGLAPSANLGSDVSIFEAVHGSAPYMAGQNVANPTALMFSSVLMLRHLEEFEAAYKIEQALLYTIGVEKAYLRDLDRSSTLTTSAFADRVIGNFGKETDFWPSRNYRPIHYPKVLNPNKDVVRKNVGIDVYIESQLSPDELGKGLEKISLESPFELKMISNQGVQLYPFVGGVTPDPVDHWRARFIPRQVGHDIKEKEIFEFLAKASQTYRWAHLQLLFEFDGEPAYTKAQGES